MDLKLDNTGDLDITSNVLTLLDGIDYIAQSWLIRLRTILGEWFLDQRIGVPYFQHIFVKGPNWNLIRSIFRQATYSVPGIKTIDSLELALTGATRALDVSVSGKTEDLETYSFVFSEMIIDTGQETV